MNVTKAATDFGKLVRTIRKQRKLTSSQVAERVNIEVKHLGRIERGEKRPSFELIIALADALEASPSAFFDFESTSRDSKALKKHIIQQLDSRDTSELHKVIRFLKVLLN